MKPLVRRADSHDLEELIELIQPHLSPGFHWPEENFRSEFAYAQTWVIEQDSKIRAFCCLRDVVDAWEISVLATRKDAHQKGWMKKLLTEIMKRYGRERHYWLEVHETNVAAQKLYEKMGFTRDGARGGYYSDGSAAFLYSLRHKP